MRRRSPPLRARHSIDVATDIGGTFTDLVFLDGRRGVLGTAKAPSTPADFSEGVHDALDRAGIDFVGQRPQQGRGLNGKQLLQIDLRLAVVQILAPGFPTGATPARQAILSNPFGHAVVPQRLSAAGETGVGADGRIFHECHRIHRAGASCLE